MDEYMSPEELESFLANTTGERDIGNLLRQKPRLLYWTFCRAGGHDRYAFSEFPLGSEHVADFVLVNSYSGAWEVKFIELEPVDDRVFTKKGTPSMRFAGAIKQVDDWADFYNTNKPQIHRDLVRWAKSKDLLGYSSRQEPCNYSGDYLSDPQSVILDRFHILIGRRSVMTRDFLRRKASYSDRHAVEVVSYDSYWTSRVTDMRTLTIGSTELAKRSPVSHPLAL